MKPILFNTAMVRAILEGRKTVTRRVVKPQPWYNEHCGDHHEFEPDSHHGEKPTGFVCMRCGQGVCPPHFKYPVGEAFYRPYCWPGDVLYVRETWHYETFYEEVPFEPEPDLPSGRRSWRYVYKADNPDYPVIPDHWRPSIHMPKEAARLFLRVTDVRVERLQEITPEQVDAEGCKEWAYSAQTGELLPSRPTFFKIRWDSTIKKADLPLYGWDANPWVWVIEFERIGKEESYD